jgi:hypothetical protein
MVNLAHGLRPSEDYRWFFGDDDLDIRARTRFSGIVTVPVTFEHLHAGAATDASPVLQGLIVHDEEVFRRAHPAHYVQRKLRDRMQGRTGKRIMRVVDRLRPRTLR